MKLYWSAFQDGESWTGPFESDEACKADACCSTCCGLDGEELTEIWIAPVDSESDDDELFWDQVASGLLFELDGVVERMAEDGWLDPEDGWDPTQVDRDRILANALRQVLGPRPEWRTVDTAKARRVEL